MSGAAFERLVHHHRSLASCRLCPGMIGPPVMGRPVGSSVLLIGQAPGPHEGRLGRPFAWTAGKTLFRWFSSLGVDEERVRGSVYLAAVARCFPGKAKGGGDRKPEPSEISACRRHLETEAAILKPRLLIPVGSLAIEQVLGRKGPLAEVVGRRLEATWLGRRVEVVGLPHPSGASTWHRTEPGRGLLERALAELGQNPEWLRAVAGVPTAPTGTGGPPPSGCAGPRAPGRRGAG